MHAVLSLTFVIISHVYNHCAFSSIAIESFEWYEVKLRKSEKDVWQAPGIEPRILGLSCKWSVTEL